METQRSTHPHRSASTPLAGAVTYHQFVFRIIMPQSDTLFNDTDPQTARRQHPYSEFSEFSKLLMVICKVSKIKYVYIHTHIYMFINMNKFELDLFCLFFPGWRIPALIALLVFFLAWVANTRLNHWTKRVVSTWLTVYGWRAEHIKSVNIHIFQKSVHNVCRV